MSKGQETKTAILDEALHIASRVGFTGLTIGQLAEQTGMSKSGLFAHFRSKEQLQLQTLEHARRWFIDTAIRPALAAPRGENRVRALFERWLAGRPRSSRAAASSSPPPWSTTTGRARCATPWSADQRDWLESIATVAAHRGRRGRLPRRPRPRAVRLRAPGPHPGLPPRPPACSTTRTRSTGPARAFEQLLAAAQAR